MRRARASRGLVAGAEVDGAADVAAGAEGPDTADEAAEAAVARFVDRSEQAARESAQNAAPAPNEGFTRRRIRQLLLARAVACGPRRPASSSQTTRTRGTSRSARWVTRKSSLVGHVAATSRSAAPTLTGARP